MLEPAINQTVYCFFVAEGETAEHREDLQPAEKSKAFISNTTDSVCFFYLCKALSFSVYLEESLSPVSL